MLIDAGPIVALLDDREADHAACVAVVAAAPDDPMITTWSCFTEASHLLHRKAGTRGQSRLWVMWKTGKLEFHNLTADEIDRSADLMAQYDDLPMDLADATLVATAETLGIRQHFTLDSHFRAYRLADGGGFEVVP